MATLVTKDVLRDNRPDLKLNFFLTELNLHGVVSESHFVLDFTETQL